MSQILEENVGVIDDIPESLGTVCSTITAERIRRRLDWEEIKNVQPQPGKCRFCNKLLPVWHVRVEDGGAGFVYPVVQCDRATRNWEEAERMRKERLMRRQEPEPSEQKPDWI